MYDIQITTRSRQDLIEITTDVQKLVRESTVAEGICVLWSTHTTAGLTVNENADPDVVHDMDMWFDETIPRRADYRHAEGNSDSHIKTSLVGPGVTLIVSGGRLRLGRWQGVFLCEFDGPRTRTILAQVVPAA